LLGRREAVELGLVHEQVGRIIGVVEHRQVFLGLPHLVRVNGGDGIFLSIDYALFEAIGSSAKAIVWAMPPRALTVSWFTKSGGVRILSPLNRPDVDLALGGRIVRKPVFPARDILRPASRGRHWPLRKPPGEELVGRGIILNAKGAVTRLNCSHIFAIAGSVGSRDPGAERCLLQHLLRAAERAVGNNRDLDLAVGPRATASAKAWAAIWAGMRFDRNGRNLSSITVARRE